MTVISSIALPSPAHLSIVYSSARNNLCHTRPLCCFILSDHPPPPSCRRPSGARSDHAPTRRVDQNSRWAAGRISREQQPPRGFTEGPPTSGVFASASYTGRFPLDPGPVLFFSSSVVASFPGPLLVPVELDADSHIALLLAATPRPFSLRRLGRPISTSSTFVLNRLQDVFGTLPRGHRRPPHLLRPLLRVVVLLGDEHKKLWTDIVKPAVKAVVPAEGWPASEQRLSGFNAGYGTVLFHEEPKDVAALQDKLPLYADRFPVWMWTALELQGLGANLQHYNPLIDDKISATWDVPVDGSLKAQLVVGKPAGGVMEKTFKPVEERVLAYGAKNRTRGEM